MSTLSIVRSSAGSGKTYMLSKEYIARVVAQPHAYRSILAVTFTNKATGEMKRRIVEQLFEISTGVQSSFFNDVVAATGLMPDVVKVNAGEALRSIVNDYSLFAVSTIDKFFQRIVRSFFYELGLDVNYTVEVDIASAMDRAVELTIEQSVTDPDLLLSIMRLIEELLDDGNSTNIKRSLAGLTWEITKERYQSSTAPNRQSVFDKLKVDNKKTIANLRQKCADAAKFVRAAGLSPYDFKYKDSSFLTYIFKIERGEAIEAYGKRFGKVADGEETAYDKKSPKYSQIDNNWGEILNYTVEVKNLYDTSATAIATFDAVARNFSRSLLLDKIRDNFLSILSSSGRLPISRTAELIDQVASMADVPFIFENLGTKYNTIYIDEFQDTSAGQWRGFLPLIEQVVSTSTDRSSVMLIGDVKQAIYRWRGGDWNILSHHAQQHFADFADSSISLTTNWRSEAIVVQFNNDLIAGVVDIATTFIDSILEHAGDLVAALKSTLANAYTDMRQAISPTKAAAPKGYVKVNANDEPLIWCVEAVEQLLERGYNPGDIAILTRTVNEGRNVAAALVAEGIAIASDESLSINSSQTVAFIVNFLKIVSGADDSVVLAAVNHFLKRDFITPLPADELDFIRTLKFCTPLAAAENIIARFNLQKSDPAYVQALCNEIYAFTRDESGSLIEFLDAWGERICCKSLTFSESNYSAVRILTIHKAKGLEFNCVLMPFCVWSLLPSHKTLMWVQSDVEPYNELGSVLVNYNAALENTVFSGDFYTETVSSIVDNINLLYVAVTRARRELYICLPVTPKSTSVANAVRTAVSNMGSDVGADIGSDVFGSISDVEISTQQLPGNVLQIDTYNSYRNRANFAPKPL